VDLKLLLKRGALLAAANWPIVAIQLAARTTFQFLLAVPVVGAAVLVSVLFGADVAHVLQGGIRDIFTTIADALTSEPVALGAFVAAFGMVLVGGSVFMFLVKGGTVSVLVAANDGVRPIEREPLTADLLRSAARFTLARFVDGCGRLFSRYLALGVALMLVYGVSAGGYLALVVFGVFQYGGATEGTFIIGWTVVAAAATGALVVWITAVNVAYLLVQIAMAAEDAGLWDGVRVVSRFIRVEFRELGAIFLVVLAIVIAATFASALVWSGVALIAFVPLVGLVVMPLQLFALLLRGVLFEYIGLTALGAYVTLYRRYALVAKDRAGRKAIGRSAGTLNVWG
jgi:hypothetical protein